VPIITSIKPQRNGKRVNIYLDGEFGFGIDLTNFVTLHLKVDQELTQRQVEEIVKKAEFQKTLDKLLRFVTFRPRSAKEIRDYFKRKKVHESLHQELLKRLNRLDLVNDEEFAKWWVDQRLAIKKFSIRSLIMELRGKGIDKETIEKVLEGAPINEEKMAKELIAKKAYKWESLPARERRSKMSQYLAGKGFGWDVIEKIASE
jgi:regulatory protein